MTAPKNTRLDFNAKLLLQTAPCEYRMTSVPAAVEGSNRIIVASIGIACPAGNVVLNATPWLHSDLSEVSIYYRRQDPEQSQLIRRLKSILEYYSVPYRTHVMGK